MQLRRGRRRREKDEEREADKEEGKEKKNRDEKQKPSSKAAVYENLRMECSFAASLSRGEMAGGWYRILGNGALWKLAAPRRDQREVSGNSTRVVSSASQTSSTDVTCCRQHGYRYRSPLQINVSDFSTDGFPLAPRENPPLQT